MKQFLNFFVRIRILWMYKWVFFQFPNWHISSKKLFKVVTLKLMYNILSYYLQKYAVEVAILSCIVQYMIDHNGANAKPSIRVQTAQGHNI